VSVATKVPFSKSFTSRSADGCPLLPKSVASTAKVKPAPGLKIAPEAGSVILTTGGGFVMGAAVPKTVSVAARSTPPVVFPTPLRSATLSRHVPAEFSPQLRTVEKVNPV